MAFVPETGLGLANANSLCSAEFAKSYFADRGVAAWDAADTDKQRAALIAATDYVEMRWGQRFAGQPQYPGVQALSFPRVCLTPAADNTVPTGVQKAVAEYALRALTAALAPDLKTDASGVQVVSTTKKVGPIETATTYAQAKSAQQWKAYPQADGLLRPFLAYGGGAVYR